MSRFYSYRNASVTLGAATDVDLLESGSTSGIEFPPSIVQISLKNLDSGNTIDTVTLKVSPSGGLFTAFSTTYSIAHGATKHLTLHGFCGNLRVIANSTSGTSCQVDVAAWASDASTAFQLAVDGVLPPPSSVGALTASGDVAISGATTCVGLTASGDLASAGGMRRSIGPFYVTSAASQTAVGTKLGDTVGQAWVAPYAGSVMASSGMIDAAVTGAGTTLTTRVYKAVAASPTSFSLLNAALDCAFTQAGGEVAVKATAAKDTYTFAAGDLLKVVYTTTAISNTPKVVSFLEVEC